MESEMDWIEEKPTDIAVSQYALSYAATSSPLDHWTTGPRMSLIQCICVLQDGTFEVVTSWRLANPYDRELTACQHGTYHSWYQAIHWFHLPKVLVWTKQDTGRDPVI